MTSDFVIELWSRIKPIVPRQDRMSVANALVVVCDEYGMIDDLENATDLDHDLMLAVREHIGYYEDDDEGEYEYE